MRDKILHALIAAFTTLGAVATVALFILMCMGFPGLRPKPKPSPLHWGHAYYTNLSDLVEPITNWNMEVEEPDPTKYQTIILFVTNSTGRVVTVSFGGIHYAIGTHLEEFRIDHVKQEHVHHIEVIDVGP